MKRTITLTLQQKLPFAQAPRFVELAPERILCNDIVLPFEHHPHGMKLWVIGHEFGAIGAVWANHEQDALDKLVDSGLGDSLLISEEDQASATDEEREEWAHLGNAGEPADLTHAWIAPVEWDAKRDLELLCLFAEARGLCAENLDDAALNTSYAQKKGTP